MRHQRANTYFQFNRHILNHHKPWHESPQIITNHHEPWHEPPQTMNHAMNHHKSPQIITNHHEPWYEPPRTMTQITTNHYKSPRITTNLDMNHHDDLKRALHKAMWLSCWNVTQPFIFKKPRSSIRELTNFQPSKIVLMAHNWWVINYMDSVSLVSASFNT